MSYSAEDIERAALSVQRTKHIGEEHSWFLAVDECCDHPLVRDTSSALFHADLLHGVSPVWNQRRVREDGSVCYSVGGATAQPNSQLEWGSPELGASWPDTHVILWVVGLLSVSDCIFVSENTRNDEMGVRNLLRNHVGPNIAAPVRLVGFFKKGKTSYKEYCHQLARIIASAKFKHGYHEVMV